VFGWCQFWAENVKIWWRKNSSELFKRRIETIQTYNNSKLNYQKALKWKKDDQLKFLPLLRGRRLLGGVGLFYPLRIVTRDCWNGAISIETFIATENSCCAPRFPLTGCQVTLCSGVENFGNVRVGHFPSDSATLICTRTINHPNNCVVDESGLSCDRLCQCLWKIASNKSLAFCDTFCCDVQDVLLSYVHEIADPLQNRKKARHVCFSLR